MHCSQFALFAAIASLLEKIQPKGKSLFLSHRYRPQSWGLAFELTLETGPADVGGNPGIYMAFTWHLRGIKGDSIFLVHSSNLNQPWLSFQNLT